MAAVEARCGGGKELQQLLNLWNALDARRRIIVVLASVAMFAAVLGLARMASAPSMSLLYSGLESGAAGDVVAALEQRGVAYDVRGGAIMVDSARRDELRMTLAGEGLPANSSRGYELLDNLSGFGTTSQMFNAAYWRAKEGELARTIVSHPSISTARVHIANSGNNPFQRDVTGSASVALTTGPIGISPAQARAMQFLVASAVTGLSPEDVSVIDGNGELISAPEAAPANATDDRAEPLRQKVTRLLEARVGPGNAVVEVSVETVTRSELLRERVIDPESRTVISTDTEERSGTSSDSGGDVTVASNLPDGDAGGDNSSSQNSETRERVNYEISETEREITLAPGAIKRLSVAVMVNDAALIPTGAAGEGDAPVSPERVTEELESMRDLVASAVGFDEARGDVLTLKSMSFTPLGTAGTEAPSGLLSNMSLDIMSIIQMAVAGLVALVLGLFVIRPILTQQSAAALPAPNGEMDDLMGEGGLDFAVVGDLGGGALNGEIDDGEGFAPLVPAPPEPQDIPSDDPVERLRHLINERQDETVEVLRGWLDEKQERV